MGILFNGQLALEQYHQRKAANKKVTKIDNGSLRWCNVWESRRDHNWGKSCTE